MREYGNTWTEQHRLECEARHVIKLRSLDHRRAYLDRVASVRGEQAKKELEQEILKQWKK